MGSFYEDSTQETKARADRMVEMMKSGEMSKCALVNSSDDFSEKEAFERLKTLTESGKSAEIIKFAYDC